MTLIFLTKLIDVCGDELGCKRFGGLLCGVGNCVFGMVRGFIVFRFWRGLCPARVVLADCAAWKCRSQNKESLARRLIESDSRTRRRDTFFCFASATAPALLNHRDVANAENAGAVFCLPPASMQSKRKYPKKRPPGCRLSPPFLVLYAGRGLVWVLSKTLRSES